jgi:hypothetical protein
MKISDDRGKISDLTGKRDISEISDSTDRYFFPCTRDGECRGGVVALEHVQLGGRDRWCGEWRGMTTGSQYASRELGHWAGLNGRVRTDERP